MWLVFGLITILIPPGVRGKLTEELTQRIEKASLEEQISCIVIMKEQYPYDAMESYPIPERIRKYREIAQRSQQSVIDWLGLIPGARIHQRYWVLNGFHLEASPEVILTIAQRDDVAWITYNSEVRLIEPVKSAEQLSGRPIEWNILRVMADSCWNAGFTGQGVIIGLTDTGVDYNHPALAGKWAGHWHVAQGLPPSTTPYDDHGHGTHCMGTILGGDGFGPFTEDIGVAPDARFVASKVLSSSGSGTWAQVIEGLQWIADLKATVDIKAVSNSWGGGNATDTTVFPVCRTLLSVDILPIFANGNSGPSAGSVRIPGAYSNVIGVGATTNAGDTVASFSSRGPSPNQVPYNDPNTWLRSDWNFIKPNISAPGAAVRSCIPNNQYATWDGTSMATPHVAGAVAIMCQKNPTLPPRTLYSILVDNVDRLPGVTYPNNNYGWGRLNVWKALRATPSLNTPFVTLGRCIINDSGGDGVVNPGETVNFGVYGKNIGAQTAQGVHGKLSETSPYITLTIDSSWYGNIPQNDSVIGNPYYRFVVANNTPNNHSVNFTLRFKDVNDTVWITYPLITVYAPVLQYQDKAITGGNNNGILDPGETANLIVTLRNIGGATANNVTGVLMENSPWITIDDANGGFGNITPNGSGNNNADPFVITCANNAPLGDSVLFRVALSSGVYVDTVQFYLWIGWKLPSDTGYYYVYWSGNPHPWAPVYSWFPIDTTQTQYPGTSLNLGDDETRQVNLPFTFKYYGTNYTQISICSNGWIAFGSTTSTNYTNTAIPNTALPNAVIYAMWDDLHPGYTGMPGDVYYYNDAARNRFVIEWFRVAHYAYQNTMETFQIFLLNPAHYPTPTGDGEIIVQYFDSWDQNDNTCGIENAAGTIGIQYHFDGTFHPHGVPITPPFALKYTTWPPGLVGIEEVGTSLKSDNPDMVLSPNPFKSRLRIVYQIPDSKYQMMCAGERLPDFSLRVYDITGRAVKDLTKYIIFDKIIPVSVIYWSGDDNVGRKLPSGVYFIQLETEGYKKVEKVILLR
ncbi:MAG: S8 family serine peptidase [candidate division WOR-3 bacterium]